MATEQSEELLNTLRTRFQQHRKRHPGLEWAVVQARLAGNPEKLWSLAQMEHSGGEPDVVGYDEPSKEFIFVDCSAESPS